jgi:AraC-like DNA-binding protein
MSSSDKYKQQIMNDLAGGKVESLDNSAMNEDSYDNFDDFANRSSREERHGLFRNAFHHENVSPQQMEPELQQAIAQIKPNERDDVAREFLKHLEKRGLKERDIASQLGLSTHHASRMNADDVSKLASFTYHSHPDIFQEVMADQPALIKFLSNPVVGAALGAVASKWLRR